MKMLLAAAERLGVERPAQRVLTGLAYALGLSMVVLGLYGAWLGHVNLSLPSLRVDNFSESLIEKTTKVRRMPRASSQRGA